jgi:hypothetical protein
MNLFNTLKQLKSIEPDAQFTDRSRREVLLSERKARKVMGGVFIFLRVIETGAAAVLAGFFILVLTGTFSGPGSIAPIQYSVIDPEGLHAEAQAIDMQIQLANLDYPEVTSTPPSTAESTRSTVPTTKILSQALIATATSTATSTSGASAASTSTPTSTITIDQALQKLSQ